MRGAVVQVNVAKTETFLDPEGREMTSAVRKRPSSDRVRVTATGLDGDGSTHPTHGGPSMPVHAFPAAHYPWFEARAGRRIAAPIFGENLTIGGCTEDDVRVGDVVRVGTSVLQVTQPTVRCSTLGRSAGLPSLLDWIQESLFTGWYLRVLEPGAVGPGDGWELVRAGNADWTIARLNRAMHREIHDAAQVRLLQDVAEISPEWKASLLRRQARALGAG